METSELLVYARVECEKLEANEIFLLKDLFKGYEWNRIPKRDRLLLGTLFLNEVNTNQILSVSTDNKSTSGLQKYIKTN